MALGRSSGVIHSFWFLPLYIFVVYLWLFKLCISLFSLQFFGVDPKQLLHFVKSVQIWSFSWSIFSWISTEYGVLWTKSPYSVQIQENKDQKKLRIWTLFTQGLFLHLKNKKAWRIFPKKPLKNYTLPQKGFLTEACN